MRCARWRAPSPFRALAFDPHRTVVCAGPHHDQLPDWMGEQPPTHGTPYRGRDRDRPQRLPRPMTAERENRARTILAPRGVATRRQARPAPAVGSGTEPIIAVCKARGMICFGAGDPLYERYHDEEWGRPVHDERGLYEKLCLEAFQSGLAWITIYRELAGELRARAQPLQRGKRQDERGRASVLLVERLDDRAVVQCHDRGLGEPRRRRRGHLRPALRRVLPMPGDAGR
jgi:hypothetical protein